MIEQQMFYNSFIWLYSIHKINKILNDATHSWAETLLGLVSFHTISIPDQKFMKWS